MRESVGRFSVGAQTPTMLGDAGSGVAVIRGYFGLFVLLMQQVRFWATWAADYPKGDRLTFEVIMIQRSENGVLLSDAVTLKPKWVLVSCMNMVSELNKILLRR